MSELPDYGREVRDTIFKSSMTGVAATVLAVTAFSPAGFGGLIGTSVAASLGLDHTASASNDPYARLPAFPSPLTQAELTDIRGELARTAASLEITRAATEGKIDYVRSIAEHHGLSATLAPMRAMAAPAPVNETTALWAPTSASTALWSPSAPAAALARTAHSDRDLELASLLLAHENL